MCHKKWGYGMKEKILKLIYDYSINGKIADNDFIDKIIESVICEKDLHDYLKGDVMYYERPILAQDEVMTVARYDFLSRQMKVNTSALMKRLEKFQNQSSKFDSNERVFFNNLLISQVVLHELEHVSQNKRYNSEFMDTETLLCKMGLRDNYVYGNTLAVYSILRGSGMSDAQINETLEQRKELMNAYYQYSPTERMAEIKSHKFLRDILPEMKDEAPNLYQYEHFNYLTRLNSGYEEVSGLGLVAPTLIYANGMGYSDDILDFPFYSDDLSVMEENLYAYPLQKRLTFGLPVTIEENTKVKKLITQNNKYN